MYMYPSSAAAAASPSPPRTSYRPLPMDSETVAAMLSVQQLVETVKAVDSADLWTSQKTGQPLYYQLTYHASGMRPPWRQTEASPA